MSLYQKRLRELVRAHDLCDDGEQIVDMLFKVGVIDNTLVKVLVIREYVDELMRGGETKLNAMCGLPKYSPAPMNTCENACTIIKISTCNKRTVPFPYKTHRSLPR
ncbi:hypothetical protein LJB87_00450 [Alistipes sp. OttesenSCG-928-L06]|nr:hypothetical protein [Alistipes sp. OttesenSCG-928-L06]